MMIISNVSVGNILQSYQIFLLYLEDLFSLNILSL